MNVKTIAIFSFLFSLSFAINLNNLNLNTFNLQQLKNQIKETDFNIKNKAIVINYSTNYQEYINLNLIKKMDIVTKIINNKKFYFIKLKKAIYVKYEEPYYFLVTKDKNKINKLIKAFTL